MSNTTPDPRQPQGAEGQSYTHTQYAAQQTPAQQPAPKPEPRFFQWIRESRVMRTNDRVIAGVCGGIAQELGWNVTLVRVLMVLAVFFGGFGAILYALGWFLLPDELTGAILCEEIFEGHWDWAFIGVILCVLIGGFVWGPRMPFGSGGLLAILFAMLAMYLLVDNGRRRFAASAPTGNNAANAARPDARPMAAQGMRPQAPGTAPSSVPPMTPRPAYHAGQPSVAPMPPTGYAQGTAFAAQPGVPQGYAMPQPAVAVPQPAKAPRPARRAGAGAPLVLLVLGLLIASSAVLELNTRHHSIMETLQPSILYVGTVTVAVGVIIVILGIRGHRAGGMHPFAWIAMIMALCLAAAGTAYNSLLLASTRPGESYTRIVLDGPATIEATKADMAELAAGIAVEGSDYEHDILTIDLTDYAKEHGSHKVALRNGTDGTSECPTGVVNIVATDAQVRIILPQGCSWGEATDDGTMTTGYTQIGGSNSIVSRLNPFDDFALVRINTATGDRVDVSVPPFVSIHTGNGQEWDDFDDYLDDMDEMEDGELWYDDASLRRFCNGVRVDESGKVLYSADASDASRKLIEDGGYWPCAVTASEAVAQPELVVAPNVLVGASVSIRYEGINAR